MFLSWFATWWRKRTVPVNSKHAEKIRRPKFFRFLHFEHLEERVLPSTFKWIGAGADSNWNDTANWSLVSGAGTFPTNAGDVAQFTGTPAQNLVTVNVPITVGEIDFGTASNITIAASGSNVLTLNNNAANAVLSAGTVAANTGTDSIQAPLSVATALTATLSGGTLTVNDASSTTNNIGATSTFNVNSGGTLAEATASACKGSAAPRSTSMAARWRCPTRPRLGPER